MSNMEFGYVSGTYLALPLPMFQQLAGREFRAGGKSHVMDAHGYSLGRAVMQGGSWVARHNVLLRAVRDALAMCGVKVQLEPRGLFR